MNIEGNPPPLFIGIMSGTSVDGMDVAIVRMAEKPQLVHFCEHPMPEKLRESILRLSEPGIDEIDTMGELDRTLGLAFADAALKTIEHAGLTPYDIAAIGCHGQTIRHRPAARHPFTLQIGNAATIAERTGITTVSDFRSRDMAAGGEGAPLAPFAHRQLFGSGRQNIAVLNCGYDADGELAARGAVCHELLDQLMQHPFLKRHPPKSTGREEFGQKIIDQILVWPALNDADRMTTACEFTIRSIVGSIGFLPDTPDKWLICGGGARNPHLMQKLAEQLAPAQVATTEAAGIPPQAVEAVSFAILAHRTILGQNNTLSAVTGARRDVCGGSITPGNNWPELLRLDFM